MVPATSFIAPLSFIPIDPLRPRVAVLGLVEEEAAPPRVGSVLGLSIPTLLLLLLLLGEAFEQDLLSPGIREPHLQDPFAPPTPALLPAHHDLVGRVPTPALLWVLSMVGIVCVAARGSSRLSHSWQARRSEEASRFLSCVGP